MTYVKITSIIFFSIFLLSCGFKPLNEKSSSIIYLGTVNVIGDKRITYALKNDILLISDKNSKNKYDAQIKVIIKKNNKIKDKSGKVIRYNLSITTDLTLTNIDNKTKIKRKFSRNTDYDVADVYSDTLRRERNATKNIINQLTEDIINFIKISMRNR
jgi:hypothetical protein